MIFIDAIYAADAPPPFYIGATPTIDISPSPPFRRRRFATPIFPDAAIFAAAADFRFRH